jgi:hypothetical protein
MVFGFSTPRCPACRNLLLRINSRMVVASGSYSVTDPIRCRSTASGYTAEEVKVESRKKVSRLKSWRLLNESAPVHEIRCTSFVARVHKEIALLRNAKVSRRLLGLKLNRSRANPVRRAAAKSALLRCQVSAFSDAVLASSSDLGHLIMK